MYCGMFGFSFKALGYMSEFRFAVGLGFGVAFGFRICFGSSLSIGGGERLCAVVTHKFSVCYGMLEFCADAWFTHLLSCLQLGLGSGLSLGLQLGFEAGY